MKRFVSIGVSAALLLAACTGASSPSAKVIVTEYDEVYRFLGEEGSTYHGEAQDHIWVDKDEARIEVWRAADGKGYLSLKDLGEEPVYAEPDKGSEVIGHLTWQEGFVPDSFPCTGTVRGWFKTVTYDGRPGYVRASSVEWDPINVY